MQVPRLSFPWDSSKRRTSVYFPSPRFLALPPSLALDRHLRPQPAHSPSPLAASEPAPLFRQESKNSTPHGWHLHAICIFSLFSLFFPFFSPPDFSTRLNPFRSFPRTKSIVTLRFRLLWPVVFQIILYLSDLFIPSPALEALHPKFLRIPATSKPQEQGCAIHA